MHFGPLIMHMWLSRVSTFTRKACHRLVPVRLDDSVRGDVFHPLL